MEGATGVGRTWWDNSSGPGPEVRAEQDIGLTRADTPATLYEAGSRQLPTYVYSMLHKLAMNSSPGTSHDFPGTSASRDTLPFTCSTLYVLTRCWPALPMVPCSSLSFLDGVPGPLFCFSGARGRLSRSHPRCCSAHCFASPAVSVPPVRLRRGMTPTVKL